MSKGITEIQEERGPGRPGGPFVETAPSVLREDEPSLARSLGLAGACFVIFGGLALLLNILGRTERVGIGLASIILAAGLVGLLSHAAYDRDVQIRRLYWAGGIALLFVGGLLCLIPFDGRVGGLFGVGYPCLALALLFFLATIHHETDPAIRKWTLLLMLGAGAAGAGLWLLLGNNFWGEFMVPYGALLSVMGLCYLAAYASQRGVSSEDGYRVALAIGGVGLLAIVLGLIRSLFGDRFLVPTGLLYISLGLLYLSICVGTITENSLVVLMRRELASFFYSPLIYMILVALTGVAWFFYQSFLGRVTQGAIQEPIIGSYLVSWFMVITVIAIVPFLTMKLLSEEWRTGSLEVLLTAPVGETTVVLGKFLAGFLLFLFAWVPWYLFLMALRIGGGEPFDYRPLFSFLVALGFIGANFIAMGLFFSSLTRNQVISAVLTFFGMIMYLGLVFLNWQLEPNSQWSVVLNHMNFIELLINSVAGKLVPKFLLFHVSASIIWLFLTVKVLEARRWA